MVPPGREREREAGLSLAFLQNSKLADISLPLQESSSEWPLRFTDI